MDEPFRKDLGSTSWETVFARQAQRDALVQEWLAELEVRAGEHVLDIGAGPGYVSVQAAIRVGADGLVLAVDRSADALAYLEQQQQARGIAHIRRMVADATTMDPLDEHVDVVLVTMVLHHVDDPDGLTQHMARLVPEGTRAVVAEFHPDGPCGGQLRHGSRSAGDWPHSVLCYDAKGGVASCATSLYRQLASEHTALDVEVDNQGTILAHRHLRLYEPC